MGRDTGPGRLVKPTDMGTSHLKVPEKSCHLQTPPQQTWPPHSRSCNRLPTSGVLLQAPQTCCAYTCALPPCSALFWHSLISISQFKPDLDPFGYPFPTAQTQPIPRFRRSPCSDGQSHLTGVLVLPSPQTS